MLSFEWLWALLLLPLPLLLGRRPHEQTDVDKGLQVPFFERLRYLSGAGEGRLSVNRSGAWLKTIIALSVWLLLIGAMAKPVWLSPPVEIPQISRDIMVAVDISSSMQLEDVKLNTGGVNTSRLSYVKALLHELLNSQEDTRFGLIVYGSAPYLQTPFTADYVLFEQLLGEVKVGMAGPKTMIGDALGLAINHFEQASTTALVRNRDQVLLLISDGNDTGSAVPVPEAAQLANQRGITIHSVFVGGTDTEKAETTNANLLQKASAISGGKFFITTSNSHKDIAAKLQQTLPQQSASLSFQARIMLYYWPLGAALILVLGSMVLSTLTARQLLVKGSNA